MSTDRVTWLQEKYNDFITSHHDKFCNAHLEIEAETTQKPFIEFWATKNNFNNIGDLLKEICSTFFCSDWELFIVINPCIGREKGLYYVYVCFESPDDFNLPEEEAPSDDNVSSV